MAVKAVTMLQEVQENQQMVNNKAREEHPIKQDFANCQSTADKFQLQVHDIAQQFEDFKAGMLADTLST